MSALDRLAAELAADNALPGADPAKRDYASMTDVEVVADLSLRRIANWQPITGADIYEAVDQAEREAVEQNVTDGPAWTAELRIFFQIGGEIPTSPGGKVRDKLVEMFGAQSDTVGNLIATANPEVSRFTRAQLLRLGKIVPSDVAKARP